MINSTVDWCLKLFSASELRYVSDETDIDTKILKVMGGMEDTTHVVIPSQRVLKLYYHVTGINYLGDIITLVRCKQLT